jgi:hypothetical protein
MNACFLSEAVYAHNYNPLFCILWLHGTWHTNICIQIERYIVLTVLSMKCQRCHVCDGFYLYMYVYYYHTLSIGLCDVHVCNSCKGDPLWHYS